MIWRRIGAAILGIVVAVLLVGTLAGTYLAARVGRSAVPAYVVGGLLLIGGIANAFMVPQPVWFSITSIIIYLGGTLAGAKIASPRF
ncbi:MAG TPA: hypothetical protein VII12_17820 [Thermoanaerobaculia bacterium]